MTAPPAASSRWGKDRSPSSTERGLTSKNLIRHSDPLPKAYYLSFAVIEPLLTFAGAGRAYFDSARYFVELYPEDLAIAPKLASLHPAAPMAVRQLGSCFFMFAMMVRSTRRYSLGRT